ncbi:MAG: HAD-IA family hydrolase [Planctomycetaceae bacterium]|nr:HAD-IA family hydrolase [Planctomycetaceae bacterium]
MTYNAVLFDLDGTLLDTLTDLADSTNLALRSLGFAEHPREAYRYFVGDGVEKLIERVVPTDRHDAATLIECGRRMRKEYGERWAAATRPYPGIPELLDALTERGVPMAVLSNKPAEFTRLCVSQLLPGWPFAAVVGAGPSLPKKPDPTGAKEIARRLGVAPSEVLYLGDTNTDMQTAVAAGMYPVGALWGFRTAEELTAAGARALAATPLDLLGVVVD